jgi:hypothetical protein
LITSLNEVGNAPMIFYGNYAIMGGGAYALKIIDVTQIDAPAVVATYSLQFDDWSASANDLWISDNKLYIVGSGHVGLEVADISNILSPTLSGFFIRGRIQAIEKKDNYLYVLNPYEVGGSSTHEDHRIQIIDIADPSNPIINNDITTTYNGDGMTHGVTVLLLLI